MNRTVAALLALVAIAGGQPAMAARLRGSVSLQSATVKLSDLFSDLEPGQDCDIGPAPAAGKSIVIERPQLVAIAQQFGVDWQAGIAAQQVRIERKGRSVTREQVIPLIRAGLLAQGAPESIEITLNLYGNLVVPVEVSAAPDMQSLTYDAASGRFSAALIFGMAGAEPMRLEIMGLAQEMMDVPVLARNMDAGSILAPTDLQMRRLGRRLVSDTALLSVERGVGLALRHRWMAGSPIPVAELAPPILVTRGMPVLLRLEDAGLLLTAKGSAIEPGALGERIHVLNPASRAVLIARVTGPGLVQVDTSSAPEFLTGQQSGLPQAYSLNRVTPSSAQQGWIQ